MDKYKFGDNIRSLRKAAGYTQEALAEHTGLTTASIGAWERGLKYPRLPHLFRLAEVLKVDVRVFFNEGQ